MHYEMTLQWHYSKHALRRRKKMSVKKLILMMTVTVMGEKSLLSPVRIAARTTLPLVNL